MDCFINTEIYSLLARIFATALIQIEIILLIFNLIITSHREKNEIIFNYSCLIVIVNKQYRLTINMFLLQKML